MKRRRQDQRFKSLLFQSVRCHKMAHNDIQHNWSNDQFSTLGVVTLHPNSINAPNKMRNLSRARSHSPQSALETQLKALNAFLMGQTRPLCLFAFFSSKIYIENTVGYSWIQTGKVGVEGERAYHHHGPRESTADSVTKMHNILYI